MAVDPAQGTMIAERFELLASAGSGGMGTVFRAKDRTTGQIVALKVSHEERSHDAAMFDRFEREARLLAQLRHPAIVAHVAHGKTPTGRFYLAMQWLEGEDLSARLARGPLSMADGIALITRVAEALAEAHRQGIVHRDIKPNNLFLPSGDVSQVMLLDFGIARKASTMALTVTGAALGTPNYVAPEQLKSATDVGAAADVFSMGCVVHECLAGRPPFDAPSMPAVLSRILFDEPDALHKVRPNVPPAWSDLVLRMLAKDPSQRPRDASALLEELHRLPPPPAETTGDLHLNQPAPAMSASMTWMSTEQMLVSVVLATASQSKAPVATASNASTSKQTTAQHILRQIGARCEELADGSLLATILLRGSAVDQASAAVRAALALHENSPDARIVVVTGRSAVVHEGMAIGAAVDKAVQLLDKLRAVDSAGFSGVALCDVTMGLVGHRFEAERFDGFVVVRKEGITADEHRLLLGKPTPCVGREQELFRIESVYRECIDESIPQVLLVTAPPGVGKSRLRHEFTRRPKSEVPTILTAFGDPLVVGSPYGLLRRAILEHAGIVGGAVVDNASLDEIEARFLNELCKHVAPVDRPRVSNFLGELCDVHFSDEHDPALRAARMDPKLMSEQIEHAFLDWLSAECKNAPVVLVLEDVHWGDGPTIRLVDAAMRLQDAPLFVLALARPEVHDVFPCLWSGHVHELSLRPLGKKAAERLVKDVLGNSMATPATLSRLVERAGGNALFLEELIRAAAEGNADDVPETVMAMLQARLSRLPSEPRRVLLAGSIFGESFWMGAARTVCGFTRDKLHVERCLEQLVEEEIVDKRRTSRFPGEVEYGFRHALVRDAAYGLLLDGDRASGHRLARNWLESAGETDAMVLAEHARLGEETSAAIELYGRAAVQSHERNDNAETLARVQRGLALGPEGEMLGLLRALEAISLLGMAKYAESVTKGEEAIALLPPGSHWWCKAVEQMLIVAQAVPPELVARLFETLHGTAPAPDAVSAYARAVAIVFRHVGAMNMREAWPMWQRKLDEVLAIVPEDDIYTRACIDIERFYRAFQTESDPWFAVTTAERCVAAFERVAHMHKLSLAKALLGGCYWAIGAYDDAETSIRGAIAIADQAGEMLVKLAASAWLIVLHAERGDSSAMDDIERICREFVEIDPASVFALLASGPRAIVWLSRGEFARAEEEIRVCMPMVAAVPSEYLRYCTVLLDALRGQGKHAEAAALAQEGLRIAEALGFGGYAAVGFCVAAAEALHAHGDIDEARATLKKALEGIELRASTLPAGPRRQQFLSGRAENVRAMALAQACF